MSGLELARWALFVDLGVLFGLPAAALLVKSGAALKPLRPLLLLLAVSALPLSIAGFLLLVAQMAGTGVGDVDQSLVWDLLTGSALGCAAIARFFALISALIILVWPRWNPIWVLLPAVIALGSLAWTGHAASSEEWLSVLRPSLDILHMLAASVWLGALVLFASMLFGISSTRNEAAVALSRFSGLGSALVAILSATGAANLLFLAEPEQWLEMPATQYGRLLMFKLGAVAGMLALASTNRFALTPRLQKVGGSAVWALNGLKLSIVVELGLGVLVLLLVARLGLLDPSGI